MDDTKLGQKAKCGMWLPSEVFPQGQLWSVSVSSLLPDWGTSSWLTPWSSHSCCPCGVFLQHVGDLGNITAGPDGRASFRLEDTLLKVSHTVGTCSRLFPDATFKYHTWQNLIFPDVPRWLLSKTLSPRCRCGTWLADHWWWTRVKTTLAEDVTLCPDRRETQGKGRFTIMRSCHHFCSAIFLSNFL